jgi:hypothetical protein
MAGVSNFAPTKAQIGTTNGLMVQGSNMGHFFAPPFAAAIMTVSGVWESNLFFVIGAAICILLISFYIGNLDRKFQSIKDAF